MELDVTPQPEPDELEAIAAALDAEPRPEEESPWWRAGLPGGDDAA